MADKDLRERVGGVHAEDVDCNGGCDRPELLRLPREHELCVRNPGQRRVISVADGAVQERSLHLQRYVRSQPEKSSAGKDARESDQGETSSCDFWLVSVAE